MSHPISWHDVLAEEKQKTYFIDILTEVEQRRRQGVTVYPPASQIFTAFRLTELAEVKVVILGQDPYHGAGQAHGLAFSVQPGVKTPPSLLNMYKELEQEYPDFQRPNHGYLASWAEQGVLLLNTVLTVEAGQAHSHARLGWETFTDRVIQQINQYREGVVFLLWGSHAQKKGAMIDAAKHHVLCAPHPSPLSAHRGFFGCGHFSQANQLLIQQNQTPINWQPQ